jgi:non-homologous end joining protein Ku
VKSKKSRGKDIVEADVDTPQASNVVDIMEVLKKSIAARR